MNDRRREIKKRIKKRKKMMDNRHNKIDSASSSFNPSYVTSYDMEDEKNHPLFRKDLFLLKVLISGILFVGIALLYKYPNDRLQSVKTIVTNSFEKELQFAFVTNWYEDTFGKPIAFLPSDRKNTSPDSEQVSSKYDIPINGVVSQDFASNGEGIILDTDKNVKVAAVQEGTVVFVGKKEKWGNTVIIQHRDFSESWYGNLDNTNVQVYDAVEKGEKLGIVANSTDDSKGQMFFAIKKDDKFIDPNQVMSFE